MRNDNSLKSSTQIGSNNTFGNGTVIGNNNEVIINQNNNTVSYQGDKENVFIFEKISPILMKKYGRKKIGVFGFISLISGLITIFTWLNSISTFKIFPFLSDFELLHSKLFFYLGILLFFIGAILLSVLSYHESAKCKNCGKEYAYKEYKDPYVQETKTSKGVRRITTRYYICKFCGYEDSIKSKETIPDET